MDNLAGHGLVNIAGQVWSARSAGEGAVIPAGQEVRVTQIQGVKVLVEPVQSGGPEH
ncbi:MAG: NfeD family protein [Lawsonibacter sp.]